MLIQPHKDVNYPYFDVLYIKNYFLNFMPIIQIHFQKMN